MDSIVCRRSKGCLRNPDCQTACSERWTSSQHFLHSSLYSGRSRRLYCCCCCCCFHYRQVAERRQEVAVRKGRNPGCKIEDRCHTVERKGCSKDRVCPFHKGCTCSDGNRVDRSCRGRCLVEIGGSVVPSFPAGDSPVPFVRLGVVLLRIDSEMICSNGNLEARR